MKPHGLSLEAVCGAALLMINGFRTLVILNYLSNSSKSVPGHGSISGLPGARRCHDSDAVLSSLDNEGLKLLTRQNQPTVDWWVRSLLGVRMGYTRWQALRSRSRNCHFPTWLLGIGFAGS